MPARRALWTAIVVGALVATFFQAGTASASGGGGCGGPVTDARGDRVVIEDFCFGPTILRVHRGDEVTFKNRDGRVGHTVLGANATWGSFRALQRARKTVTYRFTESGIYPYVCTWHPGMIGAVVVGGGPQMASGMVTTAEGPVVKVEDADALVTTGTTSVSTVGAPALVTHHGSGAWPAIALALAAISALWLAIRNRRSVRLVAV